MKLQCYVDKEGRVGVKDIYLLCNTECINKLITENIISKKRIDDIKNKTGSKLLGVIGSGIGKGKNGRFILGAPFYRKGGYNNLGIDLLSIYNNTGILDIKNYFRKTEEIFNRRVSYHLISKCYMGLVFIMVFPFDVYTRLKHEDILANTEISLLSNKGIKFTKEDIGKEKSIDFIDIKESIGDDIAREIHSSMISEIYNSISRIEEKNNILGEWKKWSIMIRGLNELFDRLCKN